MFPLTPMIPAAHQKRTPSVKSDKPKSSKMEKLANVLADGVRANEKLDKAREARAAMPAASPTNSTNSDTTGTGSFGRRHSLRHEVATNFFEERCIKGKQSVWPLEDIAELEGDETQAASDGHSAEITVGLAMNFEEALRMTAPPGEPAPFMRRESYVTSEPRMPERGMVFRPGASGQRSFSMPLTKLENVTAETRKRLEPGAKKGKVAKKHMVSEFTEQGLSQGNRRLENHSNDESALTTRPHQVSRQSSVASMSIRAPSLVPTMSSKRLSPRKTIILGPDVTRVKIDGINFDLVQPGKNAAGPPPVPPRSTSRNFSTLLQRDSSDLNNPLSRDSSFTVTLKRNQFLRLPEKVRKQLYSLMIIADHEVFVCACGLCSWSASKQPAITRVCHKIRAETLPIFYGENQFMIRGTYDWATKAPTWLRALTQPSRDMIKHVEISTHDIASAVCMMATLGFQLTHRLPNKNRLSLMSEIQDTVIWMTFSAIKHLEASRAVEEDEEEEQREQKEQEARSQLVTPQRMTTPQKVSPFNLWDNQRLESSQLDGADETDSLASAETISTAFLDPDVGYSGEVPQHAVTPRRARGGKVVSQYGKIVSVDEEPVEPTSTEKEKEKVLGQLENFMFRKENKLMEQRASSKAKGRYSLEKEIRAVRSRV